MSWLQALSRQRLAILALLLAAAAASWYLLPAPAPLQDIPLEVSQLEELQPLPEFRFAREGGEFTRADLEDGWNFLFFGYTACPDACPTTLSLLTHLQERMRASGLPVPRVIFVSIDPRRDTPGVASRYAAAFGPGVVGCVVDPAAQPGLLRFLGVTAQAHAGGDGTIDHTTNFYLLAPGGRWRATFMPGEDLELVLEDTAKLIRLTGEPGAIPGTAGNPRNP